MSGYDRKMMARLAREEREFAIADRREKWRERAEQTTRNAEQIEKWYWIQTRRLGVTHADLEAAVLRGWTGDVIAALPAADVEKLSGPPPADPDFEEIKRRIREAPVRPIRGGSGARHDYAVGFGTGRKSH